jgi:short-subunit dehydrogenase
MSTTRSHTALVTGASSGIGLELSHLLAGEGHDVVLVARTADRLEALAAELRAKHRVQARVLPIDLALPDAPTRIVRLLEAEGVEIDILVNNAGFGDLGPFAEQPLEVVLSMIQVNVACLTALTRQLLPGMIARRFGRVLNVSSTAAFQPGPMMAVYYATKAFVQSFSEALANEVDGSGVTVTALCPGPTRTGFQAAAGAQLSPLFAHPGVQDAATVARTGYRAMQRGQRVVVSGLFNRIGAQAYRVLPRRALAAIVRAIQQTKS